MTRPDAIERTLALLRFFWTSPQGTAPDVTGYKGFYYHFLDMTTGRRAGQCELSTVDTSFLLAGMLAAAEYFNRDSEAEREIRTLADALYRRVDWPWACNGGATVTHGWRPETLVDGDAGMVPGPEVRAVLSLSVQPHPVACGYKWTSAQSRHQPRTEGDEMTVAKVVKDPVCGMDIEAASAAGHTEHKGQMYYFCGATCKEKFDLAPDQYLGTAAGAPKSGQGCCS